MNDSDFRRWLSFILLICSVALWFVVLNVALLLSWGVGAVAFAAGLAGAVVGAAFVHFLYEVSAL